MSALQIAISCCTCRAGGAFDVQSHADSALAKFDSLIDNDSIPQLQQTPAEAAADQKQEQKAPKPELTVTYQKPLVKAAGHLLLYLEQQCEDYAKQVQHLLTALLRSDVHLS